MIRLCVFAVVIGICSVNANHGRIINGHDADIKDFPYLVIVTILRCNFVNT